MKCDSVKRCIATLERVRHVYSGRLDASVLTELDEVIEELKKLSDGTQNDVKLGTLSHRILQLISQIVSLVSSNLTDLMN